MVALTLLLDVTGNQGSSWPTLNIKINNILYFNGEIQGNQILSVVAPDSISYLIEISGIGKKFGQDGVWDTVLDLDRNILADKSVVFNNFKINDISMGEMWIRNLPIMIDNQLDVFNTKGFYANGTIEVAVTNPVLNWIIQEKFIKNHVLTSQTYSGRDKFDHQSILNKIVQIKKRYFDD